MHKQVFWLGKHSLSHTHIHIHVNIIGNITSVVQVMRSPCVLQLKPANLTLHFKTHYHLGQTGLASEISLQLHYWGQNLQPEQFI